MNEYEDVYKFKNLIAQDSKDEVSSLNNNFYIEENQKDLECFDFFHDSTNSKSIDFDHNHSDSDERHLKHSLDFKSTKVEQSTCICARCQKDIRNNSDTFAQFWLKDNKLTMCARNSSWGSSSEKELNYDQDCTPLELDFEMPESPKNDGFKIENFQNDMKSIEDFVKSLTGDNYESSEDDILAEPSIAELEPREKSCHQSEQVRENENAILELEHFKATCEAQNNAAFYSWSQNQASLALGENVGIIPTIIKGTSDKKQNAFSSRRSCFRALSAFYKGRFSKFNRTWQQKRRNKKKNKDMDELINTYMAEEFKDLLPELDHEFLNEFRNSIVAVLHSHRYKKKEDFTKDIDFSIIRDVLYSFTLDARDRFMKNPAYALLYNHFLVNGGSELVSSRV